MYLPHISTYLGNRLNLTEPDVKDVAMMAMQAISPAPNDRQQNAAAMAAALLPVFNTTPETKRRSWLEPRALLTLLATLLALALLITAVHFIFPNLLSATAG